MKCSKVILIDDDNITNFLNSEILSFFDTSLTIVPFSDPEKAIGYLLSDHIDNADDKTLILLDINMPLISGWDLIQKIENTKPEVFSHVHIHLLTSSIDENDKKRAEENPHIISILHKPLDEELLQVIFNS
jgi:CheY-like chemotaxis protein